MANILLFTITVLIWGTTWIAIAAQVGEVPILLSICLRFALAGVVMLAGLSVLGRVRRPPVWRFVVVQALCLFCFNFVGFYTASGLMASGLVAVVFSLASIFNAINARIFFGDRITARTILAGVLGATGLVLIFWQDLFAGFDAATVQGIGWAALGTLLFSFGNMASRRNGELGITPVTANSWGMCIGALALAGMFVASGQPVGMTSDPVYWGALAYLALIGSVIGFTTYLMLVARIGSARAGYATVIFPVVALTISTVVEGYSWTSLGLVGVGLTLLGNVVMFWRPRGSGAARLFADPQPAGNRRFRPSGGTRR
ncbi:DMT family transporter [Rhodovibrio salinarum]|uniref:EamA family transporter n=1 Tax=Rhodovibrio salinarum TaxID=1087 RepID=A0A934QIP4_9PROT|nr:EamA family transporter [Rhodovibrio salinarum]MBK1697509.1 EamA family transporter [Rhodovibrio salinarum]